MPSMILISFSKTCKILLQQLVSSSGKEREGDVLWFYDFCEFLVSNTPAVAVYLHMTIGLMTRLLCYIRHQ